jgi:hypothetical protein
MILLTLFCIAASLFAQTPQTSNGPARVASVSTNVRALAAEKPVSKSETLRYSINWPSSLSLGEAELVSSSDGTGLSFGFTLNASLPGFPIEEHAKSSANPGFCSFRLDKAFTHGPKTAKEETEFQSSALTATRTTANGGGKTELTTSQCPKDALTFLFFLRNELAHGRIPQMEKVFYGSPYDTRVEFKGTQTIRVSEAPVVADRVVATIKGPNSQNTVEMFFAHDATRTPVMVRVPFAMGSFSMELVR